MGYDLLPWQRDLLLDAGAVGDDGKWVHPRVGGSIPRQQGKSVSFIVWAAFLAALAGYKVLWTEHNYSTSLEMLSRFRDIFGARPNDLYRGKRSWNRLLRAVSSQTGQEWFEFKSGGVIQLSTRTKSSRLGFSFDIVVYDEAQELMGIHTQVINPTTVSGSKHNLQLIYLGTPTRAGSPAEVFKNVRAQAWEGGDKASDLLWAEYGVEEIGDIWDESRWPAAMPSLGAHADARAILSGMKDMDELGAAQEYLGYWLPDVEQLDPPVIGAGEWSACLVERGPEPSPGETVAYGVKFSPDGSTVALAAAARSDGSTHVELVRLESTSRGVSWLADWLLERSRSAAAVGIDGKSGAGALCEMMSAAAPRNYVLRPGAADVTTAAAMTLEAVRGGRLTHIEQDDLDRAATTCTRRAIGSAGGWSWGGEDAACMDAASLALWAAATTKRNPRRKGLAA